MTRTCIIGVSGYGRIHYDELLMPALEAGEVEIVGAAIVNQDEEAEKCARLRELGCPIYDDYQVMLNELAGVAEFCMIPTGIPLHRPMTAAALAAGMHVLVEKPAAGCPEDVRAMQKAADEAGKLVAVGFQHMYAASTMATKQHLLGGTIGPLESIKCFALLPRDHDYYRRNDWAGRLTLEGLAVNDSPYNNAVAHELMMALFMAGATERVAAMPVAVDAELYRANDIESPDTASLLIETEEGVPIRFYVSHACRTRRGPEIHLRGSKGTVVMQHGGAVVTPDDGDPVKLDSGGASASRRSMMTAVLDAIRGGSSFFCDLEVALRQVKAVSLVHSASRIQPLVGTTVTRETGVSFTLVPGIDDVLSKAFEGGKMLSECGLNGPEIDECTREDEAMPTA